jgi:predicted ATP-binding protein involved in virulence
MQIDDLHLKNYRCFPTLHVRLHPQMTVLVAPNGQGKTTVLDAIKVALWPFVSGFDLGSTTNDITGIHIDDVRRDQVKSHEMEWRLPAEIKATGQLQVRQLVLDGTLKNPEERREGAALDVAVEFAANVPWLGVRYRESVKKSTKTKDVVPVKALNLNEVAKALEQRIFSDEQKTPDDLPMLGYYGTGRLWAQKKLTSLHEKPDNESQSRTFAYRDCLDPASSYKHFAVWFSRVHQSYLQAQIRNLEKKLPLDADVPYGLIAPFKAVQKTVDAMLEPHTGWHGLQYSAEHEELVLNHAAHGQLKVSQLSDGIRNMLAMVGDIAYRCYKLNAHHGDAAPRRTHGIVLIDEVDMHLHPGWQQTVLTDLSTAFPKLQFVVTTHSPQVLSSIRRDSIRVLGQDVDGAAIAEPPLAMTYGEPSGDVLQSVMSIDPQPPVSERADLQRLTEMVDQGSYNAPQAVQLMSSLVAALGSQHPQLQRLQRSMQRQEALKR